MIITTAQAIFTMVGITVSSVCAASALLSHRKEELSKLRSEKEAQVAQAAHDAEMAKVAQEAARLSWEKETAEKAREAIEQTRKQESINVGNILQERQQMADINERLREELRESNQRLQNENDRLHKSNEDSRSEIREANRLYLEMQAKYNELKALYDQLEKTVKAMDFNSAQATPPAAVDNR